VRLILMLVVPALLLIGGIYMYMTSGRSVSTDDAQVKQDIVSVSAQVNGPIEQVFVKDGAHVKRGQLLFRIDPQPYQVALEQAEAQLAAARLQTQQLVTQAAGTGADITGAQANLKIKQNAFARQQALLKQGFTTRADYEDALNEVRTAETQLADARARSNNAQAAIAPGGNQPQIAQAQAAVDKARLDLSRTTVRAPMDGVVENSENLQIGQMAVQGVGMLSIVHSATAWVEANFKEKDLARMVPGQRASIEVDAYGQKFPAHVRSVGAGTGSEFSLLPAQNANGNWVKVTQRVPVRIAFDGTPSRPMIAGLSVTATVYFDDNGSAKSGK
jgi:membrane fusion protein (multidrug efflux system)